MRKPKIAFFIPGFDGGGAQKQCIYLVNELAATDAYEVVLVHYFEGVNYHLIDQARVRVKRIATKSLYDVRNIFNAVRVFRGERPEVVFSWLHSCDVYAWAARLLYRKFKWVLAERDSWYPPDVRFWIRSMVGRRADFVISNSRKGDLYWALRGVEPARRAVVENILPSEWFRDPGFAENRGRRLVCYAGRLEAQKNVLLLADAFVELARRRPDLDFLIVGEGSLKEAVASRTSGCPAVKMLPFQKNVQALFERVNVFVNVSKHEGKPNTVIENIALGNRVVLSRIDEHLELIGEGYRYLVEPDSSVFDLGSVIESAVDDPMVIDEAEYMEGRLRGMKGSVVASVYGDLFSRLIGVRPGG